jgi:hypothetical protein
VIDTVINGDYTLQSTTNAKHVVGEECFGDNTEWTGLRIQGNAVAEIAPPWVPEDRIAFNRANLAVAQFGGRWKVVEGNHWMIDTGSSKAEADRILEIIKHYNLASMCFVGICGDVRPMMYGRCGRRTERIWPGEDCIRPTRSPGTRRTLESRRGSALVARLRLGPRQRSGGVAFHSHIPVQRDVFRRPTRSVYDVLRALPRARSR